MFFKIAFFCVVHTDFSNFQKLNVFAPKRKGDHSTASSTNLLDSAKW